MSTPPLFVHSGLHGGASAGLVSRAAGSWPRREPQGQPPRKFGMGLPNLRGRAGESLALSYLELVGCRIRERNPRIGGVEVDALVEDGPDTVLVEVKLRSRGDYGGAAASVDAAKRGRLLRAAAALLGRGHARVR